MRKKMGWTVVAPAALALAFAGCEMQREDVFTEEPADTTPAAAPATEVGATLTDYGVALSRETVPAGRVVFEVVNRGERMHVFEVEGPDDEWETDALEPGQRARLEMELSPGTYKVYCPVDDDAGDHEDLGMVTELVVR